MEVVFLGTASCYPTPGRGVSCIALQLEGSGHVWLFDCGEGSQIQLQRSKIKPGKITKIFITHLHGDHLFGLPGLLCTLGNGGAPAEDKAIDLFGPLGLRKFVINALELSGSQLVYKLNIHELVPRDDQYPVDFQTNWKIELESSAPTSPIEHTHEKIFVNDLGHWDLIADRSVGRVRAVAIKHRIPSFAFVYDERDLPGSLNVEKLKSLGIQPGPFYGKLKQGIPVNNPDGLEVKPEDVMGEVKRGRKVVILGDTCETSELVPLSHDADLVIHEATMEEALREKAIEFGHSTPVMAAQFAVKTRTRRLCLSHLSPRYQPIGKELKANDDSAATLLEEAKTVVTNEKAECEVMIAEDFFEIKIQRRK